MITPYLSWSLPDPLITPGSQYATQINNIILQVDAMLGALFTPSQININQDLSFQNNNATNLRSVRLTSTGGLGGAADVGALYNNAGNLYFNNNAGAAVQVTAGSSVNAGNGNISGLIGTSASVTFDAASGIYSFLAAPGTQGNILGASGSFATLYVTGTISATSASLAGATVTNSNLTNATIANLTGTGVFATLLNAATLSGTNAAITNASIATLTASQAVFPRMSGSSAYAVALTASNAFIASLTASNALVTVLTASNAFVPALTASSAFATNLNAATLSGTNVAVTTGLNVIGNASFTGSVAIASNTLLGNTASLQFATPQSVTVYQAPLGYASPSSAATISGQNACVIVTAGNPFYLPLRLPRAGTITSVSLNINNQAVQGTPTSVTLRKVSATVDPASTSATTILSIATGAIGNQAFVLPVNETYHDADAWHYYLSIVAGANGSVYIGPVSTTLTLPGISPGAKG